MPPARRSQVSLRAAARASSCSSLGWRAPLLALETRDHVGHPLGLVALAHRGGDEHDDAVALAVGRHRAPAPLGAAYLDLGRAHALHASARRGRPRPSSRSRRPGVDDPVRVDAGLLRALAAVVEHVELARGMRVGVDGEQAPEVAGELEQPGGRVAPLGTRVDLDGHVVARRTPRTPPGRRTGSAGGSPRLPVDQASGAVPQHVGERVARRRRASAASSASASIAQLGVDAGDADVEPRRAARRSGRASRRRGCRPRCP